MNEYDAADYDLDEAAISDDIAEFDLDRYEGPTWTPAQFSAEYEVIGYAAPFVVVIRKSDRQRGTLEFRHRPRIYFDWQPVRDAVPG